MASLTIEVLRERLVAVWQPNGIEMKIIGYNLPEFYDIFPNNFTTVETLKITDSEIARIQTGTFQRLLNLTNLNLEKNQLKGTDFSFLKPLQTLTKLHLNENKLKRFTNVHLANLEELNLAENAIESFKQNNFPKLQILVLTKNKLIKLHLKMFRNFKELKQLQLESNRLNFLSKHCFRELKKLKVLNMADNELSRLPKNIFAQVTNLSELNLSGNQFTKFGKNIFDRLIHLDELDLSLNKLFKVDADFFNGLQQLTKLTLSKNKFEDLNRKCLVKLTNLKSFKVDSNCLVIDLINSDLFETNRLLVEIDFHDSKISEIANGTFVNLFFLKILDLSKNYLTKLPELFLPRNFSLEFLALTTNRLTSISSNHFTCGRIGALYLAENEDLVLANEVFKNLYEIKELYIQNIRLFDRLQIGRQQWIFPDLSHLQCLEVINCSQNSIMEFPINYFHPFVNLKSLNLGSNFSRSSYIQLLNISDCDSMENRVRQNFMRKMSSKHLEFRLMSSENRLELLILKKCDIKTIDDRVFAELRQLKILDLSNNRLKTLAIDLFKDLVNLEMLLLNDNCLNDLRCDLFEFNGNLKVFKIHLNYIRSLPVCFFQSLNRLKKLTVDAFCAIPDDFLCTRGVKVTLFELDH